MKMFAFLFFFSVAQAREGMFFPSDTNVDAVVRQKLFSTVAFSPGGGVVVEGDKIVTAAHVVASCKCPTNGIPEKCDKAFKVPAAVSAEGIVTRWQTGKIDFVLACGNNAQMPKVQSFSEALLKMKSLKEAQTLFEDYGYSPKEDIMILSFDNSQLKIPGVELSARSLVEHEPLFVLGYSGLSVRSRDQKTLRKSGLVEALSKFSDYLKLLQTEDFSVANMQIQAEATKVIQGLSNEVDQLPKDSIKRKAIISGALPFLNHLSFPFSLWNQRAMDLACRNWGMKIKECYSMVWQAVIKENIRVLKNAIIAIQNEHKIAYMEADSSLRVSFGKFKNYQTSRQPYYPGQIITDADVVSGNSGGPIFDRRGLLVGVISSGQSAASLTYLPGEGGCGFSHRLIQDLL